MTDASDGLEGLQKMRTYAYDVVLLDIKMPKMDGMEVLEKALDEMKEIFPASAASARMDCVYSSVPLPVPLAISVYG